MDKRNTQADGANGNAVAGFSWWLLTAILIGIAIPIFFIGMNDYRSRTSNIVAGATSDSVKFETVFSELVQARFRAMDIAATSLLQSRVIVNAFEKRDRDGLISLTSDFIDDIKKNHGVAQVNFWTAPATLFFRGGELANSNTDASKFRPSIVAASERKQKLLAIETGQGGIVAIRAILPVIVDSKFIGLVEFVSDFNIPLERASSLSGMKWALSVRQQIAERAERLPNLKNDVLKDEDLYILFADKMVHDQIALGDYNPRNFDPQIIKTANQVTYIQSFPITNFSGAPTITIARTRDLSAAFSQIEESIKTIYLSIYVFLAIAAVFSIRKLDGIRRNFRELIMRGENHLKKCETENDVLRSKLKDMEALKLGFMSSLIFSIISPLEAISGHLRRLSTQTTDESTGKSALGKYEFVARECDRLVKLINNFYKVELFRKELIKKEVRQLDISTVVSTILDNSTASFINSRPNQIKNSTADSLPNIIFNEEALILAVNNLIEFGITNNCNGEIAISTESQEPGRLLLVISGTAFTIPQGSLSSYLNEPSQFMKESMASGGINSTTHSLTAPLIAKIALEFYGGKIESLDGDSPGFALHFPLMANGI
jgi:hypothetical protein